MFNPRLYARCPYCGFETGKGLNGKIAAHSTGCTLVDWGYARAVQDGLLPGPILTELLIYKDAALDELYYWNPETGRYGVLSEPVRRHLHEATRRVTGVDVGPNSYWLPEIMSDAIEAAEALGL